MCVCVTLVLADGGAVSLSQPGRVGAGGKSRQQTAGAGTVFLYGPGDANLHLDQW